MFILEKYNGTESRHTCPACHTRNNFVRYVNENGEYLAADVGRCNRESKCGYHYKPKDYFSENSVHLSFEEATSVKTHSTYRFANTKYLA